MKSNVSPLKLRSFPGGSGNGWYRIHKKLFDAFRPIVGNDAWTLYNVLCRLAKDEQVKNVTAQQLADRCGVCRTTAFKLLIKLERYALVQRRTIPGKRSTYLLLDAEVALEQLHHQRSNERKGRSIASDKKLVSIEDIQEQIASAVRSME